MNTNLPMRIDVVIPAYNAELFIEHTLRSAINQSLPPRKIIVVDDGSTDGTVSLVRKISQGAPVPIELISQKNGGLSSARNAGIRASDADFLALLDADDLWEKEKLQKQMEAYIGSPFQNIGIIYCDYDVITDEGLPDKHSRKVPLDATIRGSVFNRLIAGNTILSSGSGALIPRHVFDTIGLFDETLRFGEDWDMWLRIAEQFSVDYSPYVLTHIRRHTRSMTADGKSNFLGELVFYNRWAARLLAKQQTLPRAWADRIAFRIIASLHPFAYTTIARKTLDRTVFDQLFTKTHRSIGRFLFFFIFRSLKEVILSSQKRERFFQELRGLFSKIFRSL